MTELRWKFLLYRDGEIRSCQDYTKPWKVGKWKAVKGEILACKNGFHASPTILDALDYVKGEVLALVECTGDSDVRGNKSAHRRMRIVKAYKWTKRDLVELAVYSAEKALPHFESGRPNDNRARNAIDAAKAWLRNPAVRGASRACAAAAAAVRVVSTPGGSVDHAARAAAHAAYAASAVGTVVGVVAWAADEAAHAIQFAQAAAAAHAAPSTAAAHAAAWRREINEWLESRVIEMDEIA